MSNSSDIIVLDSGTTPDTLKGAFYETKILELFGVCAYSGHYLNFQIWTQNKNLANDFDDVILKYEDKIDQSEKYRFLQAKQKSKQVQLTRSDLLFDNNFSIYKYFISYLNILKKGKVSLDDIILCTNNKFPSSTFSELGFHLEQSDNPDPIFNSHKERYVFSQSQTKETENMYLLKTVFLALELALFLFKGGNESSNTLPILSNSKDFLLKYVFNTDNGLISFKKEFFDSIEEIKRVRTVFEEFLRSNKPNKGYFSKLSKESEHQLKMGKFEDFLKNVEIDQKCLKGLQNIKQDDGAIEDYLKRYMQSLMILTNLEINDIENRIKEEIQQYIPQHLDYACNEFHNMIVDWLLTDHLGNKNQRKPIDKTKIDECFDQIKFMFDIQYLKPIMFTDPELKFAVADLVLSEFLNSTDFGITIYQVPRQDLSYASLKIYQIKPSFIYYKINFKENIFTNACKVLKNFKNPFIFVIECTTRNEDVQKFANKLKDQNFLEVSEKANVKIILICTEQQIKYFKNINVTRKIESTGILCEELADESLEYYLNSREVKFQDHDICLSELVGKEEIKKTELNVLLQVSNVGPELEENNYYIRRRLYRNIYLKKEISYEKFIVDGVSSTKEFLFDDHDKYSEYERQNLNKNFHLLKKHFQVQNVTSNEQIVEKVLWKKSQNSLKSLRNFVDNELIYEINETDLIRSNENVNLISGIAGIGKSLLLRNLVYQLADHFENHWIVKIDLARYCQPLMTMERKKIMDKEKIRMFFIENFMNIKGIDLTIFHYLSKSGRVIFLFDGFDEICEIYKNTVIRLIKALQPLSEKNRFFVASRSEWTEDLEDEFVTFSYFVQLLNDVEQKEILMNYLELDDSQNEMKNLIVEFLDKSFSGNASSMKATPLTIRIFANFINQKLNEISEEELKLQLESNTITIYDIYNHFVLEKKEIYINEKLNSTSAQVAGDVDNKIRTIEKNMENLAFQTIFKEELGELQMESKTFDEEEKREFVGMGLIVSVDEKPKFFHQTIAEFKVSDYFKRKIKCHHILNFLIEKVLVRKGCQVIRSFVNGYINSVIEEQTELKTEVAMLLKSNITVLHVAANESNSNTFLTLLNLLQDKCQDDLCDLLMTKDKNEFNMFFYYFLKCDLTIEFLDSLNSSFGKEFVKKVLCTENGLQKQKVVTAAAIHGENYLPLIDWVSKIFENESEFINEIIFTVDQHKNGVLHNLFQNFNTDVFLTFTELLNELNLLNLKDLVTSKNSNGQTFLFSYLDYVCSKNLLESDSKNCFTEILNWLQRNELFSEVFSSSSKDQFTILHYVSFKYKTQLLSLLNNIFNWLNEVKPQNFNVFDFLLERDNADLIFINRVVYDDSSDTDEVSKIIIQIFDYLKCAYPESLKGIINYRDTDNRTILHNFIKYGRKKHLAKFMQDLVVRLPEYIEDFDVSEFLITPDNLGLIFINYIVFNDGKNEASVALTEIINWLIKCSTHSDDFFTLIVNYKDHNNRNNLHLFSQYCKIINLPTLLIQFLSSVRETVDVNELLVQKCSENKYFLQYLARNTDKNCLTESLVDILEWVQNNHETFADAITEFFISKK